MDNLFGHPIFAWIYIGGWLIFYLRHLDRGPTWWVGGLFVSALWPVFAIQYLIDEFKGGDL